MAVYPKSETEQRVPHQPLTGDVARIFAACGMGEEDARLLEIYAPAKVDFVEVPSDPGGD